MSRPLLDSPSYVNSTKKLSEDSILCKCHMKLENNVLMPINALDFSELIESTEDYDSCGDQGGI